MANEVVLIIQARMTSSRLPGKVLAKIGGHVALSLMLARLARSKYFNKIVLAVPDTIENSALVDFGEKIALLPVVTGPEDDVLSRFIRVINLHPAKGYVRLTADCPLICPEIVDEIIEIGRKSTAWVVSNGFPATYPDGFDAEYLRVDTLRWLDSNAKSIRHREHVSLKLYEEAPPEGLPTNLVNPRGDFSSLRMTLDTHEDLIVLDKLARSFGDDGIIHASPEQLESRYQELGLSSINGRLKRNESLFVDR